jgi:hypothetical protein
LWVCSSTALDWFGEDWQFVGSLRGM